MSNMFKVNIKETRKTSMTKVSIDDFDEENVFWVMPQF